MPHSVLVEAAVETAAQARRAVDDGAHRIELCTALSQGGLTPATDLIRVVRGAVPVPLHVLVRPRAGGFVYDPGEVHAMGESVRAARGEGADAVVVGALTDAGAVDEPAIAVLTSIAGRLPLVAHRAVDAAQDPARAIGVMAALGFRSVLTSGAAPTAEEGIGMLRRLVHRFEGRMTILAGGSVRASNVRRIVAETGVREIHVGFPEDAEPDRVRAVVAAVERG